MMQFEIMLNSIDDVKNFANTVSRYNVDVELISGEYVVDGKSIMAMFSLDLSNPIKLNIYAEDCKEFINDIKAYIQ